MAVGDVLRPSRLEDAPGKAIAVRKNARVQQQLGFRIDARRAAAPQHLLLWVGDPDARDGAYVATGPELYNSAFVYGPDGNLSGRVDKVYLTDPEEQVLDLSSGSLERLVVFELPFARVGGRVVTPKGSRALEEIAAAGHALAVLGGKAFTVPLHVPGPPQTLVAVVKQRETPAEYPRRPGLPAKSPL